MSRISLLCNLHLNVKQKKRSESTGAAAVKQMTTKKFLDKKIQVYKFFSSSAEQFLNQKKLCKKTLRRRIKIDCSCDLKTLFFIWNNSEEEENWPELWHTIQYRSYFHYPLKYPDLISLWASIWKQDSFKTELRKMFREVRRISPNNWINDDISKSILWNKIQF